MTRNSVLARAGLIATLAGALALGACGRKGPLEVPPSANAVAAAPPQQQEPSLGEGDNRDFENRRSAASPNYGQPSQRNFILDPLLGDPPTNRHQPPAPPPPPKR